LPGVGEYDSSYRPKKCYAAFFSHKGHESMSTSTFDNSNKNMELSVKSNEIYQKVRYNRSPDIKFKKFSNTKAKHMKIRTLNDLKVLKSSLKMPEFEDDKLNESEKRKEREKDAFYKQSSEALSKYLDYEKSYYKDSQNLVNELAVGVKGSVNKVEGILPKNLKLKLLGK